MNKGRENDKKPNKSSSNTVTIRRQPWIGGPGSRLPFVVESFLGWGLAVSCLGVACYHYVRQMVTSSSLLRLPFSSSNKTTTTNISPILPLTTHSRKEILSKSTLERYQQLYQYLLKLDGIDKQPDQLVTLIRSNLVLKRLVSLFMVKQQQDPLTEDSFQRLIQVLTNLWPQLVQLPQPLEAYDYEISIIVPAYRENGRLLFQKLQEAHDLITFLNNNTCKIIEVVVVHAHCTELKVFDSSSQSMPNFTIQCIPDVGGGRGPCLNHGAKMAKGRILTFLHADTRLSVGWNEAILQAFDNNNNEHKTANACAFGFAIDTSSILEEEEEGTNQYFPPGIRAVETTANWRSHWFHLPYGDQCLSVPSHIFHHLGGYPHQCLMEDYELVRLLRHRVAWLGTEQLTILKLPAKCHVRRWQKFGVLYVTLTNSKLVNLYSQQNMTAEELFAIYYGMDPEGKDDPIPWEVELESFLKNS